MSELKELSKEDINQISEYFGKVLDDELAKKISIKELEDINLDIIINYENKELDVSVDLDIDLDELSNIDKEVLDSVINNAYLILDSYLEEHFRE